MEDLEMGTDRIEISRPDEQVLPLSVIDALHSLGQLAEMTFASRIGSCAELSNERSLRNAEQGQVELEALMEGLESVVSVEQIYTVVNAAERRLVFRWESGPSFMRDAAAIGRSLLS